jgi:hypothetical protein
MPPRAAFPIDDPRRQRKYRRRVKWKRPKASFPWKCFRCQRVCKGRGASVKWSKFRAVAVRRLCIACGEHVSSVILKMGKEINNSHLPRLEL